MDNLSTHLRLCSSSVYISSFVNYKKFINYKKFAKSTKFGVQCKRSRMGAELEEEELSRIGVEEIFDRSCTDVSDGLREALGGAMTGGPSSKIFWNRRWVEQSRPFRVKRPFNATAFPCWPPTICTSRLRVFLQSCMRKMGLPTTSFWTWM